MNLQTYLTPPFGFALFYLRGVVSADTIPTTTICRGVAPFVALQLVGLAITIAYPPLVRGAIRFFRSLF